MQETHMDTQDAIRWGRRGATAMVAFASLAALYSSVDHFAESRHGYDEIRAEWPLVADTPAARDDAWTAQSNDFALEPPRWRDVSDSARWAEIQAGLPRAGESQHANSWSATRTGRVGEAVELPVQGQVARWPARTFDASIPHNLISDKNNQLPPNYVFVPASGLRDAPVVGAVSDASFSKSSAQAPAVARAPATPGEREVVWTWVQKVDRDATGQKEVVLGSGYAPLSVVQACRARTSAVDSTHDVAMALLAASILLAAGAAYAGVAVAKAEIEEKDREESQLSALRSMSDRLSARRAATKGPGAPAPAAAAFAKAPRA
jgi:hypothetical protein